MLSRLPRPVLAVLALLYATATLLYSTLWMTAMHRSPGLPAVELGFSNSYLAFEHAELVRSVMKDSPAEKAGMLPGDRIVAVNGERVESADFTRQEWSRHKPGDTVRLTIRRPGQPNPLFLTGVFRRRLSVSQGLTEHFAQQVRSLYPVPFVVIGLTVLFLRLEDPKVWLLALLFVAFATTQGFGEAMNGVPAVLRPAVRAYQVIYLGMLGPLFYWFFAVFPTRSPVDRHFPWLKWAALALGMSFALPGLREGDLRLPAPVIRLLGDRLTVGIPIWSVLAILTLGLISLGTNFFGTPDREARRKIRVIFWGTAAGLVPRLVQLVAQNLAGFQSPPWLETAITAVAFLLPLSFAYAVVKHRVLDIPVLLKRSARYLLVQRGFLVVLSLLSIGLTLLFAVYFARYLQPVIEMAQPSGIAMGAVFGTVLLWGGSQVHKQVSGRIDRAFFRHAYDARVILEDLTERTRTSTDRTELARLLESRLEQALKPSSLAIYLQEGDSRLTVAAGRAPRELATISATSPFLIELAQSGQPQEFPHGEDGAGGRSALAALHPECLVPMSGRGGRLAGLLVLGPRLSEEPYSGEDKRLLASVASQAGTALENIRLAEEIAERMETERRQAREMEIAKEVQLRLLPQAPPCLKTLDCAARCIQARSVGGDSFDFIDLGPNRVGFLLADVSGKGVHAALLMANLQANLRSQCSITPDDPVGLLKKVNGLLWKSTAPEHFATLFFGIYDDSARRLDYVNCGHNPPVLLRPDGTVERLEATATVVGAFEPWECFAREVQIAPGDLVVVFSDGVTEERCKEEEFGEARLIEELRAHSRLPVDEIVTAIFSSVQQFGAGTQSDDLTLLILAGKTGGQPEKHECSSHPD